MVRFWVMTAVLCCCQIVGFAQTGETVDLGKPRTWTATTGHKVDATYLGREGNKIRLSLNDGQVRTILLENLSKADRQLLDNQGQVESGGGNDVVSGAAPGAGRHAYVDFLAEAKQKRLSREEGVEYYQNLLASLYKQIEEYAFKYPKDFIKEDNSFNTKYLNKIEVKKKPVSERKNLFTGEYLATPVYANEPKWGSVTQEVRYNVNDDFVWMNQLDTLIAGKQEKLVAFSVGLPRRSRQEPVYIASYSEDSNDYKYSVYTYVKSADTGVLTMGGIREEWLSWSRYDSRKGIYYTLCFLVDKEGKISIRNSEDGAFQFFATVPGKKEGFLYPRNFDYWLVNESRHVILGRYDLNGNPTSPENLWPAKGEASRKPSAKHDDPLNVFAERNIKDK